MNKYKITNQATRTEAICWGISPNHAVLNLLALTEDGRLVVLVKPTGDCSWNVLIQNGHRLQVEQLHEGEIL